MKVLVVDDESNKLKSIMKVIKNIEGVDPQRDIDITLQLNEAKQKLLETRYDLMILDLNIPEDLGSDPDKEGGTNFIEEIIYIDAYKKPRDIIILTAYDELEQKVKANENLRRSEMNVQELEDFLKTVKDKKKSVYFYEPNENPFDGGTGIDNAFEVSRDARNEGIFEGVYLKGN